jgi:glucose-1-phosphate adenylyltransferase
MNDITAMILAGGKGKRMDIFCHQRPKPILPFAGPYRVIDFTLSNCVNSDLDKIGILVDYQRSILTEYLGKWSANNGMIGKLSVLQPQNGTYTWTSDAVFQNLKFLEQCGNERVLILAGDHIYKMDYRKMLAFHDEKKADVTVAMIRVPTKQANRFGTVALDSEGRITEFVEKSSTPRSNLASMGIYIFNRDILKKRLTEDENEPNSIHDFGFSILPSIVRRDRVFAYEFSDYWQDIGTIESYYEANMELVKPESSFRIESNWPIFSEYGPLSFFPQNSDERIINSYVSPGCVIKGYVKNSVLSPGVFVSEKAEVLNSVVMGSTSIGFHSIVDRCILDEGVNIGKFCYVGFGTPELPGVWDITMLGKEVNVPAQTSIGRKCKVLPGLGAGAFESGSIAHGTVVSAAA